MDTLEAILLDLRTDRFVLTFHAIERMGERNVGRADIQEVGSNCYKHKISADGKYKLFGYDVDGDDLAIVVAFDGNTVVITVMG